MAGNDVLSPSTLRRKPIRGPILNRLLGAIFFVLTSGLGVTVLMFFVTSSPLDDVKAQGGAVWWTMAVMVSPYLGLYVLTGLFCFDSIYRSMIFLAGAVLMTGYGLFQVGNYWVFAPRPIDPKVLTQFPLWQWAGVAAILVVALAPGYLMGLFVARAVKPAAPPDPAGGDGDFKIE